MLFCRALTLQVISPPQLFDPRPKIGIRPRLFDPKPKIGIRPRLFDPKPKIRSPSNSPQVAHRLQGGSQRKLIVMGFQVDASTRVGFIGAGQMAEAMARGFDRAGVVSADRIFAFDVHDARKEVFASFGATVLPTAAQVAENSDVLILAVKPFIVKTVLDDLKMHITKDHLIISIAAGIALSSLQSWAGNARLVRVMPNTPCLVGETAAALSAGKFATEDDVKLVTALFSAVGQIHVVDEKLMNAVTGLSASGPAFIFLAIEALADGGVAAGLPRDIALSLAAQTVLGSAKMVVVTGQHPGQLKDAVASPAGTTIAGLHELEKAGFRGALMNAVVAASKRSEQLSSPH